MRSRRYRERSIAVFGAEPTTAHVAARWRRTCGPSSPGNSPFDRHNAGDASALVNLRAVGSAVYGEGRVQRLPYGPNLTDESSTTPESPGGQDGRPIDGRANGHRPTGGSRRIQDADVAAGCADCPLHARR